MQDILWKGCYPKSFKNPSSRLLSTPRWQAGPVIFKYTVLFLLESSTAFYVPLMSFLQKIFGYHSSLGLRVLLIIKRVFSLFLSLAFIAPYTYTAANKWLLLPFGDLLSKMKWERRNTSGGKHTCANQREIWAFGENRLEFYRQPTTIYKWLNKQEFIKHSFADVSCLMS